MNDTPQGDAPVINPAPAVESTPTPVAPAAQAAPATQATPPAPVADRTSEQFEKLLGSNKQLYEANELLRKELTNRANVNQQFAPINQPPVPQPKSEPVNPQDFIEVDSITGERYINEDKLQIKINELNNKTTQAQEAISRYLRTAEDREADRQSRETFKSYPELDPSKPQFDVAFSNQTRAIIYDSLINPQDYGGRPLEFKDAADFVTKSTKRNVVSEPAATAQGTPAQTPPKGADQAVLDQAQAIKDQASATIQGQSQPQRSSQQYDSEDRKALVRATREGNLEALAKRLAQVEHTVPPETKR